MRPGEELKERLVERLNYALRRPGIYGHGEILLHLLFDDLTFLDERPDAWVAELQQLRDRDAFVAPGVVGAFSVVFDLQSGDPLAAASVYAEVAHRLGYLRLDRALTEEEYSDVCASSRPWCCEDRQLQDVLVRYGQPSIQVGGAKPLYSRVLGYASVDPDHPIVFFDMWNEPRPDPPPSGTLGGSGNEPVLRDVRIRGVTAFSDDFTFTPFGEAMRRPKL